MGAAQMASASLASLMASQVGAAWKCNTSCSLSNFLSSTEFYFYLIKTLLVAAQSGNSLAKPNQNIEINLRLKR
jgi:hypothetical protein